MTPPEETAALERGRALVEQAPLAIKATEYKYFGDYEMSDNQRYAVNTLVDCAEVLPALLALARRAEAAEKDRAALSAIVRELADELEAELRARYAGMLPQMAQRLARDMDTVVRARALLTPTAEGR